MPGPGNNGSRSSLQENLNYYRDLSIRNADVIAKLRGELEIAQKKRAVKITTGDLCVVYAEGLPSEIEVRDTDSNVVIRIETQAAA